MRSQLASILRKEFHRKMTAAFPSFLKTGTAFGGVIYRKREDALQRNLFVFLEPDSKYNRFTLEFAASTESDFPFEILPGDKTPAAVRNRIRTFLEQKSDGWWRADESDRLLDPAAIMALQGEENVAAAAARIPRLVDDAFKQLQTALPRFLASLQRS